MRKIRRHRDDIQEFLRDFDNSRPSLEISVSTALGNLSRVRKVLYMRERRTLKLTEAAMRAFLKQQDVGQARDVALKLNELCSELEGLN